MRCASSACNQHLYAALLGGRCVFEEQVWRPMGGNDTRLVRNAEIFERFDGVLHRFPIGRRAHDDADERLRIRRNGGGSGGVHGAVGSNLRFGWLLRHLAWFKRSYATQKQEPTFYGFSQRFSAA